MQVPPSTLIVWLSPPPWDTVKYMRWSGQAPGLPGEWIHIFARVAGDVGLLRPAGPARHVDLYSIALGGQVLQLQAQLPGCPDLHVHASVPLCAAFPWWATEAGSAAVVFLLLQIACPGAHGRMAAMSPTL